ISPATDRTTYSPRCCAATRAGVRSSSCSSSNADAQPASHPSSSKAGKASLLCERVKLETRASAESVRLDEEPRALRKEAKRNRHVVDLLVAGNALTVAACYGQHQPAGTAAGPNAVSIPATGITFRTEAERMKSHSSAVRQLNSSQ